MRRLLLLPFALPLAATAQPTPPPLTPLRPSVVAHVGRDGAGVGIVLPLNPEAAARLTLTGDGERQGVAYLCALGAGWDCPSTDVRTRRASLSAAVVVRAPGWGGARPYVGADVALRAERQTETRRPAIDRMDLALDRSTGVTAPAVTRQRFAVRPGLVGGLDVSLGPRLGLYAEGSASAPGLPYEGTDWYPTERFRPFRAAAGLRVAW